MPGTTNGECVVHSTEAADVLPSCLTDPPLHRVGMIANSCRTVSHPNQIDDLARTSRDLPASGVWGLQVCVEVGATCVRCLEPAPRLPTPFELCSAQVRPSSIKCDRSVEQHSGQQHQQLPSSLLAHFVGPVQSNAPTPRASPVCTALGEIQALSSLMPLF